MILITIDVNLILLIISGCLIVTSMVLALICIHFMSYSRYVTLKLHTILNYLKESAPEDFDWMEYI